MYIIFSLKYGFSVEQIFIQSRNRGARLGRVGAEEDPPTVFAYGSLSHCFSMSLLLHLPAMNLTKHQKLDAAVGRDDYKTRLQSSVISCE